MTIILKGKEVSDKIREEIKSDILSLNKKGIIPTIATVRLGDNPDDISYERNIIKISSKLGINHVSINDREDLTTEELIELVDKLNKDDSIHGILLLSLLTTRDDKDIIRNKIAVEKDIDGIHPLNLEKIFQGHIDGFGPCASKAAIKILEHYGVDFSGKKIAIVNRSMVIGKPLAMMALAKNATVTICHSHTENLKEELKDADIVFVGIGKAKFFTKDYFTEESIIVDIGIDMDENNKLCGDVDFDDVSNNVKMITPVPGGIGGVTTSILLSNVVNAAKKTL